MATRSSGSLSDTRERGGTLRVRNTEPPMTLSAPTTVWPPSTVALAYRVAPLSTVGWRLRPRMIWPLASLGKDSAPERDALVELDAVADLGGLADHHAGRVIDEKRRADFRARDECRSRSSNAPTRS